MTPSYNQGPFLEATIQSVLDQGYPNLEYMIVDGGSTDDSVNIIKRYQRHLTWWVSEKDRGQTHAINKGFRRSTGDLVNWLNSDDLLAAGALNSLADSYKQNPGADLFFGDYLAVDQEGRTLYHRKSAPYNPRTLFWGRQLSSQPAVFFKRNLLARFGYLDESHHFCMDTEFWIRMARNGASFIQIPEALGITRVHGDAKTTRLQRLLHQEHKKVVRDHRALKRFCPGSRQEDLYYTVMNRFWRISSALRRMLFRGDVTFMSASNALKTIAQEK